ncbi:MAG: hypothetical protein AB1400_01365 [Pseudomonadota bacterium]
MRVWLAATLFGLAVNLPVAQAEVWNTSWDGTLYGYASRTVLNDASVLNPQNRMARLAQAGETAEARLNFKAESDQFRFSARPILLTQNTRNVYGGLRAGEAYLSQWQARWRVAEQWSAAVGRDVLNWGAGSFVRRPAHFISITGGVIRCANCRAWMPSRYRGRLA